MISSPGAFKGTIISDVDPFKIKFFGKDTFLTQSSQLYLEFAITNPGTKMVYCWDKSFRREKADFRHLPEFAHIEFEGNIGFEANLSIQQKFIQYLIHYLLSNRRKEMGLFVGHEELRELEKISKVKKFKRVSFVDAFKMLRKRTGDRKYDDVSIKNFSAHEEVMLTEMVGAPVFVTDYIGDEVAFYHAPLSKGSRFVRNADLLFPGYGEVVGSGERVHTRKETIQKAKHFKLDMNDYRPYIESRKLSNPVVHSGWGMGIERFIQTVLKLPYIWEVKPFPRVDGQNRP
jgi:asparaginyl-tRNA synthetase